MILQFLSGSTVDQTTMNLLTNNLPDKLNHGISVFLLVPEHTTIHRGSY